MYFAVKARDLSVRIADQDFVFLASIHGDTAYMHNFLIQKIALAFINTVDSYEICG